MFAPSTLKPAVPETTPNFPDDLTLERVLSIARIFLCYFFAYHGEVRQVRHPK